MDAALNRRIDSLALDHRRGAADIVDDATLILKDIAKFALEDSESAAFVWDRAVLRLANGHPTMAPMLKMLNSACYARDELSDWGELVLYMRRMLQEQREQLSKMVHEAIPDDHRADTLITFSYSTTVLSVIMACRRNGWPQDVLLGESRPLLEGVSLARQLCAAGIPTTLYTDCALTSQVARADAVWIGGDCFSKRGLVNKVGTKGLVELARYHHVPVVAILATDKLLPASLTEFYHVIDYNPREVTTEDIDGLSIVNRYFEEIPHDVIDWVYTEWGFHTPAQLVELIQDVKVSRSFRAILKS